MTCARAAKLFWQAVFSGAMLAVIQATSWADDVSPPSWPRLGATNRSTSAEWDFDDDGTNPLLPDGNTVPLIVGDFKPTLDGAFPGSAPHPSGAASGVLTYTAGSGFLNSGTAPGTIAFNVPNWIDQEPFKFLRIQVTYTGPTPGTRVFGFLGVPGDGNAVTEFPGAVVLGTVGQSLHMYQDWTLQPNPDWEQVVVDVPVGTFIDQVVIDTISTIPEPSALALAMMALFASAVALDRRRA
jgi:hypothetical protein